MASVPNVGAAASPGNLRVALVGNPNTGKSTLFNALAGMNVRTGNYPGVTSEKKTGICDLGPTKVTVVDLPGTYSLAPRSPERTGRSRSPDRRCKAVRWCESDRMCCQCFATTTQSVPRQSTA